MKLSEIRLLKTEPRNIIVGEKFITENTLTNLDDIIKSGYISYYKIIKVNNVKNSYVYEPFYEDIEEG